MASGKYEKDEKISNYIAQLGQLMYPDGTQTTVASPTKRTKAENDDIINAYLFKAQIRDETSQSSKETRRNAEVVKSVFNNEITVREIDTHNDELIPPEKSWLDEQPSSSGYNQIKQRVLDSRNNVDELVHSHNLAHQYIDNEDNKTFIKSQFLHKDNEERDIVITRMAFELLSESVDAVIDSLCCDLMARSKASLDILNRSFIRALTNFSDTNKRFLKMSGRIEVLRGALCDVEEDVGSGSQLLSSSGGRISAASDGSEHAKTSRCVTMTQSLLVIDKNNNNNNSHSGAESTAEPEGDYLSEINANDTNRLESNIPPGAAATATATAAGKVPVDSAAGSEGGARGDKRWAPLTHSTLSISPVNVLRDTTAVDALVSVEQQHVEGLSVQQSLQSPLTLPSGSGKVTLVRSFTNKAFQTTTLIIGTTVSRVLVYSVPWDGTAAYLTAKSPATKESQERADIVEIKASPVGANMFITMNASGFVTIFHTNQDIDVRERSGLKKPPNKTMLSYLFGGGRNKSSAQSKVTELAVLFKLDETDLTLALPIVRTVPHPYNRNRHNEEEPNTVLNSVVHTTTKVVAGNRVTLEASAAPTVCSFHSTVSMRGRPTSVVIGTVGGDMVKFNLDYHIPSMDCAIMYPRNDHIKPISSDLVGNGNGSHGSSPGHSRSNSRNNSPERGAAAANIARNTSSHLTGELRTKVKSSALPFVQKEYIHSHDDKDHRGFVLTGGKQANKGNQVYREMLHFHKAPIIAVDVVSVLSPDLVSVDADGHVAIWRYSSDFFAQKQWFVPQCTVKLDLRSKVFEPFGEVIGGGAHSHANSTSQVPEKVVDQQPTSAISTAATSSSAVVVVTPTEDELLQLVCRDRHFTANKHMLIEVFYPMFSSTVDDFVQYSRRTRLVDKKVAKPGAKSPRSPRGARATTTDKSPRRSVRGTTATTTGTASDANNVHSQHTGKHHPVAMESGERDSRPTSSDATEAAVNDPRTSHAGETASDVNATVGGKEISGDTSAQDGTPPSDSPLPVKVAVAAASDAPSSAAPVVTAPTPLSADLAEDLRQSVEPRRNIFGAFVAANKGHLLGKDTATQQPLADAVNAPAYSTEDHTAGGDHSHALSGAGVGEDAVGSVTWSYVRVRERNTTLSIVNTRLSSDGIDLLLLLKEDSSGSSTVGTGGKSMWGGGRKGNQSSGTSANKSATVNIYHFVPLHLVSMRFHSLHTTLNIDTSTDALLDYCVGPIMLETLSRVLFVLTKQQGVRIFSLETATEYKTSVFPYQNTATAVAHFQPTKISLCGSQRVLTMYAPGEDARIVCCVIKHQKDGSTVSSYAATATAASDVHFRDFVGANSDIDSALRTVPYLKAHAVPTVIDIVVVAPPAATEAEVAVGEIISEVLQKVFARLDVTLGRKHQAELVASLYGSSANLGFIEPTVWPPPEVNTTPAEDTVETSGSSDEHEVSSSPPSPTDPEKSEKIALLPNNDSSSGLAVPSDDEILATVVLLMEELLERLVSSNGSSSDDSCAVERETGDIESDSGGGGNTSGGLTADSLLATLPPPSAVLEAENTEGASLVVEPAAETVPVVDPTADPGDPAHATPSTEIVN